MSLDFLRLGADNVTVILSPEQLSAVGLYSGLSASISFRARGSFLVRVGLCMVLNDARANSSWLMADRRRVCAV